MLAGLEFKVLGSQCYQRLYGHANPAAATPQYGSGTGRLLTAGERLVLVENTAKFIEALEAERVELERLAALEAARRQQQDNERAARQRPIQTHQATRHLPQPQPQLIPDDARSPLYDGAEMLRWRWKNAEVRATSIAAYKVNPSLAAHHVSVMTCFQNVIPPTPYQFALDVELRQFLPKRYIFRALDELNLIERM